MNNTFLEILLIFVLLLLNGVFAMSEIALVSARKTRLQQRADDGNKGAKIALELAGTTNRLLSTVQIGITLIGVLAGALGGATLAEKLTISLAKVAWIGEEAAGGIALAIVVLLTTYFSLVIGELIPKRLGLNNPEQIAAAVAPLMRFLAWLTAPVVKLLSWSTDLGLRIIGASPSEEPPVTEEEIRVLMEQGTQVGVFEEAEQDMIESVFKLSDRYVETVMTPRTEVEWIDLDESFEEIRQFVLETNHTRYPVGQGSLDNVQGVLVARDFLSRCQNPEPFKVQDLLQPPLFVPDSMSALRVLDMMRDAGIHIALVIDEYGGLLGMVTLYDILEAIVGDIRPEGEEASEQVVQREDGSWLIDGLMDIEDYKEFFNLETLPGEERIGYQTLGGFVMSQLGVVPTVGQHFEWSKHRFEVMDMDGKRVDKVLINLLAEDSGTEPENGKS